MDWNPGTWGEGFPAPPNLGWPLQPRGSCSPGCKALLSTYQMWALLQVCQGSPTLGVHQTWLHSDPGLTMGPLPAPCRNAKAASGAPLASGLQLAGGSLSARLLTHSRLRSLPTPRPKLSPRRPSPRLHPPLDSRSWNSRLPCPEAVGQPYGYN